nr:hypothetical protein [Rhodocyclus tenuis]
MGGTQGNPELSGNLSQTLAWAERDGLVQPLVPMMQSGQRGSGQGIESLSALVASVALQAIGVAVANGLLDRAVLAARGPCALIN